MEEFQFRVLRVVHRRCFLQYNSQTDFLELNRERGNQLTIPRAIPFRQLNLRGRSFYHL
jgi:hypothetical protein